MDNRELSMSFRKYLFVAIIVLSIILLALGCAPVVSRQITSFGEEKIKLVRLGMSVSEFETIFGRPDTSYSLELGKSTERQWTGLVYKYFGSQDPTYQFIKHPLTNTFVFFVGTELPKLNNWTIEFSTNGEKRFIQ